MLGNQGDLCPLLLPLSLQGEEGEAGLFARGSLRGEKTLGGTLQGPQWDVYVQRTPDLGQGHHCAVAISRAVGRGRQFLVQGAAAGVDGEEKVSGKRGKRERRFGRERRWWGGAGGGRRWGGGGRSRSHRGGGCGRCCRGRRSGGARGVKAEEGLPEREAGSAYLGRVGRRAHKLFGLLLL